MSTELPLEDAREKYRRLNLNTLAMFPGSTKKVVCEHLTLQWLADQAQHKTGRFSYASYASVEVLQSHMSEDLKHPCDAFYYRGPGGFLFTPQHFGSILRLQASQLEPDGPPRGFMLLTGSDANAASHAMGLSIRLKSSRSSNTQPQYVLRFYDPNQTATHRRLLETSIDAIEDWSLEEWIPMKKYLMTSQIRTTFLRLIPFAAETDYPSVTGPDKRHVNIDYSTVTREFGGKLVTYTPSTFEYLYELVLANISRDQVIEVLADARGSPLQLKEMLGVNKPQSILEIAASHGFFESAQGLVDVIIGSVLSTMEKLEVLCSGSGKRLSPLHAAMVFAWPFTPEGDHLKTIQVLMDCFLDPTFTQAQQLYALTQVNDDGTPAHALFDSEVDSSHCARAFLQPILNSGFSNEDKVTILCTQDSKGRYPLALARNGRHANAAVAFVELVSKSTLDLKSQVDLLASGQPYDENSFDQKTLIAMKEAVMDALPENRARAALLLAALAD
ncbi:ShET2/EspL2 family type III secretion system effector toxin [Variovorax paradoxus]|nr:ShET2/EspL2 family type III secretion system effector toxin [Variovorax paradoxus]